MEQRYCGLETNEINVTFFFTNFFFKDPRDNYGHIRLGNCFGAGGGGVEIKRQKNYT